MRAAAPVERAKPDPAAKPGRPVRAAKPRPGKPPIRKAVVKAAAAAKARKGAQRTPTTHKLRKDGPRRPVGPKKPSGRR